MEWILLFRNACQGYVVMFFLAPYIKNANGSIVEGMESARKALPAQIVTDVRRDWTF